MVSLAGRPSFDSANRLSTPTKSLTASQLLLCIRTRSIQRLEIPRHKWDVQQRRCSVNGEDDVLALLFVLLTKQ